MSGTRARFVAARPIPDMLQVIALEPPGWTRLEPQSLTGDPTPGLEGRVHDPLWLLARQWQFGEFLGENAGTPLAVHAELASTRLVAWRPGDPAAEAAVQELPDETPLDPLVEAEPGDPRGPGLRTRAEAGALLAEALEEAGLAGARAALLAACPLDPAPPPPADVPPELWKVPPHFVALARTCPDGAAAAAQIEAAGEAGPPWLADAPDAVRAAAAEWLAWCRDAVPPAGDAPGSWIAERIEHRFSVGTAAGDVLHAPLHDGGAIDWYSFDHAGGGGLPGVPAPEAPQAVRRTVLASPLRFVGMPADRLWQFEEGQVNLGALEVQPHDLARLCFVEFAMVYGNDWFTAPLDVEAGSLVRLTGLTVTDSFGETQTVERADDGPPDARFRLFQLSAPGDATLPALLAPPAARGTQEGRPMEEVLLLRDEAANMCWAVERLVEDPAGEPRSRGDEERPAPISREALPGAELRYLLQTTVPRHWIPLVPVPTGGAGGFELRKGTMTERDESLGRLLHPLPFTLKEEEVPREGVRVMRVPSLARDPAGRVLRWVARRVSVGRGEGASGLVSDEAVPAGTEAPVV
jgi:hypothetical protein